PLTSDGRPLPPKPRSAGTPLPRPPDSRRETLPPKTRFAGDPVVPRTSGGTRLKTSSRDQLAPLRSACLPGDPRRLRRLSGHFAPQSAAWDASPAGFWSPDSRRIRFERAITLARGVAGRILSGTRWIGQRLQTEALPFEV